MSNTLGIDFAADLREFAADIPSTLVVGGVTVTGTRGSYTRSRDVDPAGIINPTGLMWEGVAADFTGGVPAEGAVVAIDGTNYHVEETTYNEERTTVRFTVRRI